MNSGNNRYFKERQFKDEFSSINPEINSILEDKVVENSFSRIIVVFIFFSLAYLSIIFKLVNIGYGNNGSQTGKENSLVSKQNIRKDIVDRNGNLLAVDLKVGSLYANPKIIFEPEIVAKKLIEIFPDLKYDKLYANLTSPKSFIWVKRNVTPKEMYMVNDLGIPGLEFEMGTKRIYPYGPVFSHMLGYVGIDGKGLAGIEKEYDDFLLSEDKYFRGSKHDNLKLTVDVRVQGIVRDELKTAFDDYRAQGGVGIVMNCNSGEILSLVSLPDFDPQNPGSAIDEAKFNRATLGSYELGSIMKAFSVAIALDTNKVSLNDVFFIGNSMKISKFNIHDFKYKGDWLSVPQIFMYSSNIGVAKMALEYGEATLRNYFKKFGFFDGLPSELPERGMPVMPKGEKWSDITLITASFGHGYMVTPMHAATALGSLINGGYVYKPKLIIDNKEKEFISESVIKNETSEKMKKLFRLVVEKGYGKRANAEGYFVGGKSGTAEKVVNGRYSKTSNVSSFLAAFPINDPKYTILVMLDDPKKKPDGEHTVGGRVAAPIAKNIINRIAPILNVSPINPDDEVLKERFYLEYDINMEENAI